MLAYIPTPWILWVRCRMIFPEGMGMEMALFQQALFLFTLLEVLLPNRNEPQTTINSQIGHTHTHKQTNWGNDNPISGGESRSSWCSWTRSIIGNPAMPAGNILAERLQDLRSHQSVAYHHMSTRQNSTKFEQERCCEKRVWGSRFPPYGNIAHDGSMVLVYMLTWLG